MADFERAIGQELPGFDFPWEEEVSQRVWSNADFSTGYTFAWNLKNGDAWHFVDGSAARQDKTTGVTGYDGGVRITPEEGDCDVAAAGIWWVYVKAIETATGFDRVLSPKARPTVHFKAA